MTPEIAAQRLSQIFGIEITPEYAAEALKELDTYLDLEYETLRGKYKLEGDAYVLLAVENTHKHNGAWGRYVDHLKATQRVIIVQSVVNTQLLDWLLRNGFNRTKKHKNWVIWRAK